MKKVSALLALLAPSVALAAQTVSGDNVAISYGDGGTWCDSAVSKGFQANLGGAWIEFVWPGSPWQHTSIEYDVLGTPYDYDGNTDIGSWSWTTDSESDLSTARWAVSEYRWTAGAVTVVKTEKWLQDGYAVLVQYDVTNTGADDVESFRLMTAFDPDQDMVDEATETGTFDTLNDTVDRDGDGTNDWAVSVGPDSGYAVGIAPCDPSTASLGHSSDWYTDPDDASLFSDDEDAQGDNAVHWVHTEGTIAAGATVTFAMIVAVGETEGAAETTFDDSRYVCPDVCQDADGDEYYDADCGGDDCDDREATVFPGAADTWYDGIDGDCAGDSDYDADGDGSDSDGFGGTDCDDEDAAIYEGATDAWYDGVDSDCAGNSDYDADADGFDSASYGGTDCDDANGEVSPGAPQVHYDDVDQDCNPANENDADGDGHDSADHGGDDCDDSRSDAFPGNTEIFYDGVDNACDGGDDFDQDGDGEASDDFGGTDCEDLDFNVNTGMTEVWYDGVDQDCDGNDLDQDGDGHDSADHGGDDCFDTDATQFACGGEDTDPQDTDEPSDTDDGDDTAKGGCDCSVTPSGSPAAFAGLLALVGLVLRRRR